MVCGERKDLLMIPNKAHLWNKAEVISWLGLAWLLPGQAHGSSVVMQHMTGAVEWARWSTETFCLPKIYRSLTWPDSFMTQSRCLLHESCEDFPIKGGETSWFQSLRPAKPRNLGSDQLDFFTCGQSHVQTPSRPALQVVCNPLLSFKFSFVQ